MGRNASKRVCLVEDWDYEELTTEAVKLFEMAPYLNVHMIGSLIVFASALEVCNEDTVPKGIYPISGAILIDLMEEHDIPQWKLALALGVDRNVIYRRVKAERETRGVR